MSNKESMGKHTAAFHATVPLVYKIKPYAFKLALKTVQETLTFYSRYMVKSINILQVKSKMSYFLDMFKKIKLIIIA